MEFLFGLDMLRKHQVISPYFDFEFIGSVSTKCKAVSLFLAMCSAL